MCTSNPAQAWPTPSNAARTPTKRSTACWHRCARACAPPTSTPSCSGARTTRLWQARSRRCDRRPDRARRHRCGGCRARRSRVGFIELGRQSCNAASAYTAAPGRDNADGVAARALSANSSTQVRRSPDALTAGRYDRAPRPGDETGRRSGLKIRGRKACGFDSHPGHHACDISGALARIVYGGLKHKGVRDPTAQQLHRPMARHRCADGDRQPPAAVSFQGRTVGRQGHHVLVEGLRQGPLVHRDLGCECRHGRREHLLRHQRLSHPRR